MGNVRRWRYEQFRAMGFTDEESEELADARDDEGWPVSVQKARGMIGAGCSTALALRILL